MLSPIHLRRRQGETSVHPPTRQLKISVVTMPRDTSFVFPTRNCKEYFILIYADSNTKSEFNTKHMITLMIVLEIMQNNGINSVTLNYYLYDIDFDHLLFNFIYNHLTTSAIKYYSSKQKCHGI